ncbi:hypothetical protein WJX72_004516 [[Myrmecia] bisecta]|uniref:Uncharacterized protein n=1 Tax=[Myrmecia] bisecta TaxID=41462 RepID=A0AAW1QR29_9CHLO
MKALARTNSTCNIRTVDNAGPYNFTLLSTLADQVAAGIAAKGNFTDKDVIDFLVNVECLEGQFDTWGVFGRGFLDNLEQGGPVPIGARAANLTAATIPYLQEVALQEQGHTLFTRHAGSNQPCPPIDFDGGFNALLAVAYGLPAGQTVQQKYGAPFDPFKNDVNFVVSMLTLEELGATGNKGLIPWFTSPVLQNGVAGLATSANSQATIQRFLLWQLRNQIVEPFGETAEQTFARISAYRNNIIQAPLIDQGIVNTDPRFIAVPYNFLNLMPTDIWGTTFVRSPQQIIQILTIGNPNGVGGFFPSGLKGVIRSPAGFNAAPLTGLESYPPNLRISGQEPAAFVGTIVPLTPNGAGLVPDQNALTQALGGPPLDGSPNSRGAAPLPASGPVNTVGPPDVQVAQPAFGGPNVGLPTGG